MKQKYKIRWGRVIVALALFAFVATAFTVSATKSLNQPEQIQQDAWCSMNGACFYYCVCAGGAILGAGGGSHFL